MVASCSPLELPSPSHIRGSVILATSPLAGADLRVWQLGTDGERLEPDPVLEVQTDDLGQFEIDVGSGAYGALRFEVYGGQSREYWSSESLRFDDSSQKWPSRGVDRPLLSGLFYRVHHRPTGYTVAVTPWTTLAEEWARARFVGFLSSDPQTSYGSTTEAALARLSKHFGLRDLIELEPVLLDEHTESLSPAVRYSLSLAAFSTLARQIAERSSESVQVVNTMRLTHALAEDASGNGAIFDGLGPDRSELAIGTCPPPGMCPGETCDHLCDLGPQTLRVHLARALVAFIRSDRNKTALDISDVLDMAVDIAKNDDPELFGQVGGELFDLDPPGIEFSPSLIRDENNDTVVFDAHAVPIHTSNGPPIDLSDPGRCHAVAKYIHRLESPDDNPLRWQFSVHDPGIGFQTDAVEYQVWNRTRNQLVVDWSPARMLGGNTERAEYEIVLLGDRVGELLTEQGEFELSIRATDQLQNRTPTVSRCWNHTPLPPPLQVGLAGRPDGENNLDAATLGETNSLALPLNGSTEVEVMEFEVRNGTTQAAYVTLDQLLDNATYSKQWIKTNAELETNIQPNPDCATAPLYPCLDEVPEGSETTGDTVTDQPVPAAVWGIRVWDVTFSQGGIELDPCRVRNNRCEGNEYHFRARYSPIRPRQLRVVLILRDMAFLAPAPPPRPGERTYYLDLPLDWDYFRDLILTGNRYGTWLQCSDFRQDDPSKCAETKLYRHFRALLSARIDAASIQVTGRVAAAPLLAPQDLQNPGTFRDPVGLSQFSWAVQEDAILPPLYP
ncbi:MAG: hypothetical protein MJE77_13585 [Proteobacteria bacterium]|nr:hypothetical protein [Pseudomonadota bacterium]